MPSIALDDFRYGLNLMDLEQSIPQQRPDGQGSNGTYDAANATVDPLGNLIKRGGSASLVAVPSTCIYVFRSKFLDKYFLQAGTTLKKYSNAFVFEGDVLVLPTADKIAMVDFNSTSGAKCVLVHKTGGVYDSPDGITWTNRSATVKGTTIAVWHNKLWVAGDTSNLPRVWWSNAGTSATWTTATDFNDLREKDVSVLTCLHETAGILLAYKEDSAYRINDPATGEYSMIDRAHGASAHESVASIEGLIGSANQTGFYTTDGISALVERSHPVAYYFKQTGSQMIVNVLRNRFIIGLPFSTLEWVPRDGLETGGGWWPHEFDVQNIVSGAGEVGDKLVLLTQRYLSPFTARLSSFGDMSLGSDVGAAIPWHYALPWLRLNGNDKFRIRRLIVEGCVTGTLDYYLKRDYIATEDAVRSLNFTTLAEARPPGVQRALSARLYNSSAANRALNGVYLPPIAISRIRLDYIPLGRA